MILPTRWMAATVVAVACIAAVPLAPGVWYRVAFEQVELDDASGDYRSVVRRHRWGPHRDQALGLFIIYYRGQGDHVENRGNDRKQHPSPDMTATTD